MILQSIARRLVLLAGSSFLAVGLGAATFSSVALTPVVAQAADECGDPDANGTGADTFTCAGTFPAITYADTNGNLTLRFQGPLTVTGGILVTPSGTNTVTLNRIAESPASSGDPSITNSAGAGIRVERSTGGTIAITTTDTDQFDDSMVISGTTAGIRTRNTGSGSTSFALGGGAQDDVTKPTMISASAGAGIDAATDGTGNISFTMGAVRITGTTAAIRVESGANVSIGGGSFVRGGIVDGALDFHNTGNTNFNNTGEWYFNGVSTLRNSSVAGNAEIGNDLLIGTTGASATIDFAAGSGTGELENNGYLIVGDGYEGASVLNLAGLDIWNNNQQVFFGGGATLESDGETNDRIVVTNSTAATFTGGGDSLFVMDVDFTASQGSCTAAVTADCLDLRGHNTAGTTAVLVNPAAVGFTAERIVLVDVAGAGSDDGAFHVSDQSPGYRPFGTGMLDTGLFLYELVHDDETQQHVLMVAAVDGEGVELNLAGRAAFTAWDTATGAWFGRQADLRNALAGGAGSPGGWVRLAGSFANQDMISSLEVAGTAVDVLTSHTQDTTAFVGGIDLVGSGDGDNAWVVGLTAGKVVSELGFDESPNGFEFDGYMVGAYASYLSPGFFVDGAVNALRMDATYALPSVGIELEGDATSLGYRIEGGLRWDWGDGVLFEPMATLSYVTTDLGSLPIAPGVSADFDSVSDFRGALGARLSGDVAFDRLTVRLAGLGRVWQSVNGDTSSAIATPFGDFGFTDETDGTLGEVGVSVGLFDAGGRFSILASSGVKFREDYQNVDVSIGVRYQW